MIDLSLSRSTSRIATIQRMFPISPTIEHSGGSLGALSNFVLAPHEHFGLGRYGLGVLVNVGTGELVDVPPNVASAYWAGSPLPTQYAPAPTPPTTSNVSTYAPFAPPSDYKPHEPYTPQNPAGWPPSDAYEIHNLGFDCVPIDWHENVQGIATCMSGQSPIKGYSADQLTNPSAIGTPGAIAPPASSLNPYVYVNPSGLIATAPTTPIRSSTTPTAPPSHSNPPTTSNVNTATDPVTGIYPASHPGGHTAADMLANAAKARADADAAIADAQARSIAITKAKADADAAAAATKATNKNTSTTDSANANTSTDFLSNIGTTLSDLFAQHPILIIGMLGGLGYMMIPKSEGGAIRRRG